MKSLSSLLPNRAANSFMLLGYIVPAFIFIAAAVYYNANIPIYDDITQIIWIINTMVEGKMDASTPDYMGAVNGDLHALFYPNAGHIPTVTRLIALTQYYMGGINFLYAEILACSFWLITVFLLLRHAYQSGLSLFVLLPLPFLLFSLAQWEAMSSMLGGIQMYIGTLFLPLLVLLALVKNRAIIAAIIFFFALFASGGSMGLLPLGVAYLFWRREWKSGLIFGALSLPSVLLFRHLDIFGPALLSQHLQFLSFDNPQALITNLVAKIKFFFVFLGNITTNGSVDLRPLAAIHCTIGVFLLVAGLAGIKLCKGQDLFKLVFLFMVMLAAATTLMRSEPERNGLDMVPRYAVFALLTCAMVYLLIAQAWLQRWPKTANIFVSVMVIYSLLSWGHSAIRGRDIMYAIKVSHISQMERYIASGDASELLWDPAWCDGILKKARQLNVYDYSNVENF